MSLQPWPAALTQMGCRCPGTSSASWPRNPQATRSLAADSMTAQPVATATGTRVRAAGRIPRLGTHWRLLLIAPVEYSPVTASRTINRNPNWPGRIANSAANQMAAGSPPELPALAATPMDSMRAGCEQGPPRPPDGPQAGPLRRSGPTEQGRGGSVHREGCRFCAGHCVAFGSAAYSTLVPFSCR